MKRFVIGSISVKNGRASAADTRSTNDVFTVLFWLSIGFTVWDRVRHIAVTTHLDLVP
jgi:hypothetical protein